MYAINNEDTWAGCQLHQSHTEIGTMRSQPGQGRVCDGYRWEKTPVWKLDGDFEISPWFHY